MPSRRRAREFALQLLYQVDLRNTTPEDVLSTFWGDEEVDPVERKFAESEVKGVAQYLVEIDQRVESSSHNWKVARMSYIDRNILRLGTYELLYAFDIPRTVVINECIELGKRFSTQESGAFINGILDRIAQSLPPDQVKTPRRGSEG